MARKNQKKTEKIGAEMEKEWDTGRRKSDGWIQNIVQKNSENI